MQLQLPESTYSIQGVRAERRIADPFTIFSFYFLSFLLAEKNGVYISGLEVIVPEFNLYKISSLHLTRCLLDLGSWRLF